MNILHTSDWHLGRPLYGRRRYEEFAAFLEWLAHTVVEREIDALLVAGDIFDSSTPSNQAQSLYYRFLHRIAASRCRHTVIIAGNHDSPSFLNAPGELLKALGVHVVGSAREDPAEEVLTLRGEHGAPELIVCAIPYLRDRDIRTAEAGESIEDKARNMVEGIRGHYAAVGAAAEQQRAELGGQIPIVGMGHLFAAGGTTVEGDGVRELYVGSLVHVPAAVFPACFDYLALGHLHTPQRLGGSSVMRYSGSPLPLGFGEAGRQKQVCAVTFEGRAATVQEIEVPVFRALKRIEGDWQTVLAGIERLAASGLSCWLEIIYTGDEIIGDLRERLEAAVADAPLEIVRIKNSRAAERALRQIHEGESLDDLNADEVFTRCLEERRVPEEQRPELMAAYRETLSSLHEDDVRAE